MTGGTSSCRASDKQRSLMRPDALIDVCRTSHRRFVAGLVSLTDDDLGCPSLLPGYSRAHVVAHVINKTKAHVVVFEGPPAGEIRQLHPDGYDPDRAAAAGASRSSVELRADAERSFQQLEAAWDALDDAMWDGHAIMTAGLRTMAEVVAHHLRNIEVHHVDLDTGYRPSDWPALFVDVELGKRLRGLADRADHAELLAWLLDRGSAPDLGPW